MNITDASPPSPSVGGANATNSWNRFDGYEQFINVTSAFFHRRDDAAQLVPVNEGTGPVFLNAAFEETLIHEYAHHLDGLAYYSCWLGPIADGGRITANGGARRNLGRKRWQSRHVQ